MPPDCTTGLTHHLIAGDLGEAVLEPFFTDENPAKRAGAIRAISVLGESSVRGFTRVREALDDPAPMVRRWAVDALSRYDERRDEVVAALLARLRDDADALVRERAARGLAGLGADAASAIPDLLAALDTEIPPLRRMAMFALGEVGQGDLRVLFGLRSVLDELEDLDRGHARWALARVEPESAVGAQAVRSRVVPDDGGGEWISRSMSYAHDWLVLRSTTEALAIRLFGSFEDPEGFTAGVFFEAWSRGPGHSEPIHSEGLLQEIIGMDYAWDDHRSHTYVQAGSLTLGWSLRSVNEGWVYHDARETLQVRAAEEWARAREIVMEGAEERH